MQILKKCDWRLMLCVYFLYMRKANQESETYNIYGDEEGMMMTTTTINSIEMFWMHLQRIHGALEYDLRTVSGLPGRFNSNLPPLLSLLLLS